MDKFKLRRLRLVELINKVADGKIVLFAEKIGKDPSYVGRMLYEEGKKGRKKIGEEMAAYIEDSLNLPRGWLDDSVEWPFRTFSIHEYELLSEEDKEEIETLIKLKIDRRNRMIDEKK